MKTHLTLTEKEALLRETVALPTKEDWSFLIEGADEEKLVDTANNILVAVLGELLQEGPRAQTFGDIARAVYVPLRELSEAYPTAGVCDSEACLTVARFFALNYSPALYDYLRYNSSGKPAGKSPAGL